MFLYVYMYLVATPFFFSSYIDDFHVFELWIEMNVCDPPLFF